MKVLTFATICLHTFSVLIPIQSESIYVYNYYNNFGDIFPQGEQTDLNIYRYEDIDNIFAEKYEGSNIGGAILTAEKGTTVIYPWPWFHGHPFAVTVTVYCGLSEYGKMVWVQYHNESSEDYFYVCEGWKEQGWTYNHTYIPSMRFSFSDGFRLKFTLNDDDNATLNKPFGLDEIRLTVVEEPPTTAPSQIATNPQTAPEKTP